MKTSAIHNLYSMPPTPPTLKSRRVAVIGAGAAGLVAARELHREGHDVVVLERGDQVGGTWVYTPRLESDPLGLDPHREIVHSSLYSSLRTNLPRECMGYRQYPFVAKTGEGRDPRRYPNHREVFIYLKEFATEFGLEEMVKFETEVVNVRLSDEKGKWEVKFKGKDLELDNETFDAVIICNGHYTEPRLADFPGLNLWPGKQIHSHNYRVPEPFRDKIVILIGSSNSAADISRELAEVAKEVHVASRGVVDETYEKLPGYDNLWLHSMVDFGHEDGRMVFRSGRVVHADVIVHCTGYKYHYPFLGTNCSVTVEDNRVGPLYKHIFPPSLAPCLSFVGLPWKVFPFPLCEFQSKWIARVLSGKSVLPSAEEMMEDTKAFYSEMEACGMPKRYTHNIGSSQFEYNNWLAAQCGCPLTEKWREEMYIAASKNRGARPETYRDEWEDDHLVSQAYEDFSNHASNGFCKESLDLTFIEQLPCK